MRRLIRGTGPLLGLALLTLGGCTSATNLANIRDGFNDAELVMRPDGPVGPIVPNNINGQIGIFVAAYNKAREDQLALINPALLIKPGVPINPAATSSPPPDMNRSAQTMAVLGMALADDHCSEFFANRGNAQKWIGITRDVLTIVGTATGAILAVSSMANTVSTGIVAATTGAMNGGLDAYTRNFLFASDNIESVRTLIVKVMDEHRSTVMSGNRPWTFDQAVYVINQHQMLCAPAAIRAYALEAMKTAKPESDKPNDPQAAADPSKIAQAAKDAAAAATDEAKQAGNAVTNMAQRATNRAVADAQTAAQAATTQAVQPPAAGSSAQPITQDTIRAAISARVNQATTAAFGLEALHLPQALRDQAARQIADAIAKPAAKAAWDELQRQQQASQNTGRLVTVRLGPGSR